MVAVARGEALIGELVKQGLLDIERDVPDKFYQTRAREAWSYIMYLERKLERLTSTTGAIENSIEAQLKALEAEAGKV